MKSWLAVAFEASVLKRALKVAAVVGSILAVINHGDTIITGHVTLKHWVQVALTFLVPYCVSTYAAVQAIRQSKK